MIYAAVLLVVLLASVMGLAFLHTVHTQTAGTLTRSSGLQAHYLAESAAHHAMWRLLNSNQDSVQRRVDTSANDAHQGASAMTRLGGTHVKLGREQLVGFRYPGIPIPQGATVTSAYLEFIAADIADKDTPLLFRGQAADDAPVFVQDWWNLSLRPLLAPAVTDNILGIWVQEDVHQTPDLSPVIQAIVDQPGWAPGNALVLMAISLDWDGTRPIYTYDDDPAKAPLLVVEYDPAGAAPSTYTMHALAGGRYGFKTRAHTETKFATVATVGAVGESVVRQSYVLPIKNTRRAIRVTNTGGDLTDYPVRVELTTNKLGMPYSGVAVDGSNLRFEGANGAPFDFWIESWNPSDTSLIWVEVPDMRTGLTTFFLALAEEPAINLSDPQTTFLFFDDFEEHGPGDVPDGWSGLSTEMLVQNDAGRMVLDDGEIPKSFVRADHPTYLNVAVRERIRSVGGTFNRDGVLARFQDTQNYALSGLMSADTLGTETGLVQLWYRDGAPKTQIGSDWALTGFGPGWHIQELGVYANTANVYIDHQLIGTGTIPSTDSGVSGFQAQSNVRCYRDWHLVRKYSHPEPTAALQ